MTDLPAQKRCGQCKISKPLDAFNKRAPRGQRYTDGLHYWCQDCVRVKARAYYAANSYGPRDYHFQRKYGISIAERDELIRAQDGRCAICGTENGDARWNTFSVDHSHDTNRVRGMLCSHCNRGLGHFLDDPDRLLAAAAYLLQHSDVLGQLATKGEPA